MHGPEPRLARAAVVQPDLEGIIDLQFFAEVEMSLLASREMQSCLLKGGQTIAAGSSSPKKGVFTLRMPDDVPYAFGLEPRLKLPNLVVRQQ